MFYGCPVEKYSPSRRMGASSAGQGESSPSVPQHGSRPNGYPLQCSSQDFCQSVLSSSILPCGCLVSGLEPVGRCLPFSTPVPSPQGVHCAQVFSREDDTHSAGPPSADASKRPSKTSLCSWPSPSSATAVGSGRVDPGWKTLVLSLDSSSLLIAHLTEKYGYSLANRLVNGKRDSTQNQINIAWKAFQEFISLFQESEDPDFLRLDCMPLSISPLLHFCVWLREQKNFQSSTICNYKSSVAGILTTVFGLDCSSWEFSALRNNFFLEKPSNPPRIPQWDLQKVLDLLSSNVYVDSPSNFSQLKKTRFLLAIATGNRVSEIHAITRNGLSRIDENSPVQLAVKPGFLYKNQRANRSPPNIEVFPLSSGSPTLCPVKNLALYLRLTSSVDRGPLFINSRTNSPIHKSTVSRLICQVIEEADPGKFPKAHDTRRVDTSIAWTRGLEPSEITKRTFWRSSNIFIERYLSHKGVFNCVALNTV